MLRTLLVIACLHLGTFAAAQAAEWSRYVAPGVGIDLPIGTFEVVDREPGRLRLTDSERDAELEVFSGQNAQRLSIAAFRRTVEAADPGRSITYRAGGKAWFVVSGHMLDATSGEDLIYYAKFLFNTTGSRFAAFELSYPRRLKASFDWTVTRLEKSLSL